MSAKTVTYITLALLMGLAIAYLISANNFQQDDNATLGSGYFPNLLGALLLILCLISCIQTYLKKENTRIEIQNPRLILVTIGITILFVISWSFFGLFYLHAFIFLVLLLSLYRLELGLNTRNILINVSVACGVTLFIYVIFDLTIAIKF